MCEEVFKDLLVSMSSDGRRCAKPDRDVRCQAIDAMQLGMSWIATQAPFAGDG
jgi:hypothetical protein